MNADTVIIGAGPAGIFTALEMRRRGSRDKIIIVEKGQSVEKRRCPKSKTGHCMNCKPYCHITTGFSGAGAFSDGKLSLSYEVGGELPRLIGEERLRRPSITPTGFTLNSARTSMWKALAIRRRSRRSVSAPFRLA